jgi:hypothetical protein
MKQSILLGILIALSLSTALYAAESLDPARIELPAEQNAYVIWTNVMPEIRLPEDRVAWDAAFMLACNLSSNMPAGEARKQLDAWLESRKKPLAIFAQGIALGRLQIPAFGLEDYFGKFNISGLRHIARVKIILAREYAERSEYAKSAREFTEVFKMGQLIAAGDGAIIHYLAGIAVQSMGLNGMRWLVSKDDIPPDVLRQIQTDLAVTLRAVTPVAKRRSTVAPALR